MEVTVILPTHNPDPVRLRRTLLGLKNQSLPFAQWETILVNNASTRFPDSAFFSDCSPPNFSVAAEPALGLTAARRCGLHAARAGFAVLVDDDNVLDPAYLARTLEVFAAHPQLGALGGKSVPEFAVAPPVWAREFFPLLALRDLGSEPLIATTLRPPGATHNEYPACAPIGAGLALRREAWLAWLDTRTGASGAPSDRRGSSLSSGGDNDLVFAVLRAGWGVGYFPQLSLTHLIPGARLQVDYLERLNRGIQQSWMQVLTLHDANPWPPLTSPGAALRKTRAWFRRRAWSSSAARIRWQGDCGHFDGRVSP